MAAWMIDSRPATDRRRATDRRLATDRRPTVDCRPTVDRRLTVDLRPTTSDYRLVRSFFPVPGSAILRCCSARTDAGVTFAIVVWTLFFQPATTSPSPFIMASN